MAVFRLVKRTNKETVATLEWMLAEARRGDLNDLVSSFRDGSGTEHAAITGIYRADASKALMALMRLTSSLVSSHHNF